VRPSRLIAGAFAAAVTLAVASAATGRRIAEGTSDVAVAGDSGLAVGAVPQRPLEPGEGLVMRRAGIEWLRVWISWAEVEAERGEYDWSRPDARIEAAADEGLRVLPMLFGSPEWATDRDGYGCWRDDCIPFAPASTETRAAFADFAAAAARRYGPENGFWSQHPSLPHRPLTVWQIWNEQNMNAFFRPRADPGSYAALLAATAEAIRDEEPEAGILLGGMFGPRSRAALIKSTDFLRALYRDRRLAGSFDAVAVHPYSGNARGSLAQIRAVRRTIRRHGSGEELWVTEIGWASGGNPGQDLVKDRRKQARLVRRTFGRFAAKHEQWDLRGAFWYAWRDTERGKAVCAWCPRSGLISRYGAQKPAYRVMRRVVAR
jgi:polysaccharide biosynthesis protein PslG